MAHPILEISDDARIWGHRTLQQLEHAESGNGLYCPDFSDPADPIWAVFVAQEIEEEWTRWDSNTNPAFCSSMERLLQKLAYWLRLSLQRRDEDEELAALKRLVAVQSATTLYLKVRTSQHAKTDGALLQVAFASGHQTAITMGVDLLLQQPPDAWTSASLALSPLLQYREWDLDSVFPRILESSNQSILASALDIANHLVVQKHVDEHPCQSKAPELTVLLGGIAQRLGLLEENPGKFGDTPESIQRILFDSVSLCVSLCHTMSLIGDEKCVGKLMQASELKHRRIRTEAAFALAKLNQEHGTTMLLEMVQDPAVRIRVLAYADELGFLDRIDEKHRSVLAVAESQLAQWLAQVEQMGLPPTKIELLEQRTLIWPGFEAPQECFLFRFGYEMHDGEFSNVGFAGPVAKAFSLDLGNVPLDDAFSMFAGWDIEHPEAYETIANKLAVAESRLMEEWRVALELEHFDSVEPAFFAHFFEQNVLVGFGIREGRSQAIAFDGHDLIVPTYLPSNQEALWLTYYLWRGREFFKTFT